MKGNTMKLLQAILFSTLVSMTALAHADAKLDRLVEKCDQILEQKGNMWSSTAGDGTVWGDWTEKKQAESACRRAREGGNCDRGADAAMRKFEALEQKMKNLNCSEAREQQKAEESGLSPK